MRRTFFLAILCAALLTGLAGCNYTFGQQAPPAADNSLIYTQAAETLFAQLTQVAQTQLAAPTQTQAPSLTPAPVEQVTPTPEPPTPTVEPAKPSDTPLPSPTPTATTAVAPTTPPATQSSSGGGSPSAGSSATPAAAACNSARFVEDVTVPDGTTFAPNIPFVKTWRIRNAGTCIWTPEYSLVFLRGNQMDADDSVSIARKVLPGDTVDVSVRMTSPAKNGSYTGQWMLESGDGERFGVGSSRANPVWVKIVVKANADGVIFDFAASYCAAVWESDAGTLRCPGREGDERGFVLFLSDPELETRRENEPALWTNPQMVKDGWIKGTYPAIRIKSGDRFLADIGCLADNKKCNVHFELRYLNEDDDEITLGEWDETFDRSITRVDIDLSALAGDKVAFVLIVTANGRYDEDAAFWLVPQIRRDNP